MGQTVADAALTIPPSTEVATAVTGAAYYNNDLDPDTATTLFVLDTNLDQIAIQSPANAGILAATGKLGVDADSDAGFDIHYTPDDTTADGRGLAVLKVNGTAPVGCAGVQAEQVEQALLGGVHIGQHVPGSGAAGAPRPRRARSRRRARGCGGRCPVEHGLKETTLGSLRCRKPASTSAPTPTVRLWPPRRKLVLAHMT